MGKLKEPPVYESFDPNKSENWREFLRDLTITMNERLPSVGTLVAGQALTVDDDDNIVDGGSPLIDDIVTEDELVAYVGERYTTENLLPEAGTEHGARFGSYKIGLLTEDDYVFFDENGKAIFYGVAGIQVRIPRNSSSVDKIAVFDTDGNLEYRTIEQLADDLDGILATRTYVSETFITENLLPEAGTEDGRHYGSYKIGNEGNNSEFEEDGTLVFNGSATVWDDLRFPVGSVRGAGAFAPATTAYKDGIILAFDTGPNNESVQFIGQFPHSYKLESTIECHIHWTIPVSGAGGGAENVKWDLTYSWAAMGGSFPGSSSATVTVDVQNLTADDHIYTDIVDIPGTGIDTVSSIIICSLTRDVGVANDYASDAYFLEADFHFEMDTVGSREEASK